MSESDKTFIDSLKAVLDEEHDRTSRALFGKSGAQVDAEVAADRAERVPACSAADRDFKRCAYCVKRSAGHCQSRWDELP